MWKIFEANCQIVGFTCCFKADTRNIDFFITIFERQKFLGVFRTKHFCIRRKGFAPFALTLQRIVVTVNDEDLDVVFVQALETSLEMTLHRFLCLSPVVDVTGKNHKHHVF